jgi:hypothetical protein
VARRGTPGYANILVTHGVAPATDLFLRSVGREFHIPADLLLQDWDYVALGHWQSKARCTRCAPVPRSRPRGRRRSGTPGPSAFAGEFVDRAAVPLHDRSGAVEHLGHDLAQPLCAHRRRDVHGMHDIGEQHSHLLVLSRLPIADRATARITETRVLPGFRPAHPATHDGPRIWLKSCQN